MICVVVHWPKLYFHMLTNAHRIATRESLNFIAEARPFLTSILVPN